MNRQLTTDTRADPATWAESRLRLGQANVGLWVVLALVTVASAPSLTTGALADQALAWALCVGAFALIQLPFDIYGGFVLPVQHGRRPGGVRRWGQSWLRGVLTHSSVLVLVGWAAMAVGRAAGSWAAVALCMVAGAALVAAQGVLATFFATGVTRAKSGALAEALHAAGIDAARVRVVHTDDTGFVGGWAGPLGSERLLVPARWASLPPALAHAALVRRRLGLTSGSRALGVLGALAFNASGAVVALAIVPGTGFSTASELVVTSAAFTLWSFFGILTLPTLSRRAVLALDRASDRALSSRHALVAAIQRLDADQEDEPERAPWTETIFHPVPARAARFKALQEDSRPVPWPAPWRVARMTLYTGWAHFSWLSRAVHCNIGRPELWAVYPGD